MLVFNTTFCDCIMLQFNFLRGTEKEEDKDLYVKHKESGSHPEDMVSGSLNRRIKLLVLRVVGENQLLKRLSEGNFSENQFRAFMAERFRGTTGFLDLLKEGICLTDDPRLIAVLMQNLADEIGIVDTGILVPNNSHEYWRMRFLASLNVDIVRPYAPGPGAKAYNKKIQEIIQSKDVFMILGAFLALELGIPAEFQAILNGCIVKFPHVFAESISADTETDVLMRLRMRLYLAHHIDHDPSEHYGDLLRALEPYQGNAVKYERMLRGIEAVEQAKFAFYSGLGKEMGVNAFE